MSIYLGVVWISYWLFYDYVSLNFRCPFVMNRPSFNWMSFHLCEAQCSCGYHRLLNHLRLYSSSFPTTSSVPHVFSSPSTLHRVSISSTAFPFFPSFVNHFTVHVWLPLYSSHITINLYSPSRLDSENSLHALFILVLIAASSPSSLDYIPLIAEIPHHLHNPIIPGLYTFRIFL